MAKDCITLTRANISAIHGEVAFPSAKKFAGAVNEVENNVQAPRALVNISALSVVALAVQSQCDVRTPVGSISPLSLMTLLVGESGERKSSVLNKFLQPLRDIQNRELEACEAALERFRMEEDVWLAKKKLLVAKAAKADDEAAREELIEELNQHLLGRPVQPRQIKILYEDSTSEALFKGLSTGYPYVGLISSEGKEILSGSAFRDMSKQNAIWSGDDVTIDRVGGGRFTTNGARLTVGVMVQNGVLEAYLKRRGNDARASGLLARFLVVDPESTQGTRFIEGEAQSWAQLDEFNKRIAEIANEGLVNYQRGGERKVLGFSPAAAKLWMDFYNSVESEICVGGYFELAPDHASKLADNVARVAALISYFECGEVAIESDFVEDAVEYCMSCSADFKRLFVSSTRLEREAEALMLWLRNRFDDGLTKVRVSDLQRRGPFATRKKDRLALAMNFLIKMEKIQVWEESGIRYVGEQKYYQYGYRRRRNSF